MADKELRWLIYKINQNCENILTIFDCCHSGDNTRSVVGEELTGNTRKIERGAIDPRDWKAFIFSDQDGLTKERFEEGNLSDLLPEGKHVHMAACRDIELALEEPQGDLTKRRGVFSRALLHVIDKYKARITYKELQKRVIHSLRTFGDGSQTPQVYFPGKSSTALQRLFLTNELQHRTVASPVIYNEQAKEWRIGIGALQGISPDPNDRKSEIFVYHLDQPDQKWKGKIKQVFLSYSVFIFVGETPSIYSDEENNVAIQKYVGEAQQLSVEKLKVSVDGPDGISDNLRTTVNQLLVQEKQTAYFEFTEEDSDFILSLEDKLLKLYSRKDGKRPLLLPIQILDKDQKLLPKKAELIYNDFQQLAKWNYLRDLSFNCFKVPGSITPHQYPIELKAYQLLPDGTEIEIDLVNGKFILEPLERIPGVSLKAPSTAIKSKWNEFHDIYANIRFELKSNFAEGAQSNREKGLCCSLLFLFDGFGLVSLSDHGASNVGKPVFWMKEGESKNFPDKFVPDDIREVNGRLYYNIFMEEYIYRDNWSGQRNYFKLLVSNHAFDVDEILLDPIDLPYSRPQKGTRGIGRRRTGGKETVAWEVKTFECFFNNPLYLPEEVLA